MSRSVLVVAIVLAGVAASFGLLRYAASVRYSAAADVYAGGATLLAGDDDTLRQRGMRMLEEAAKEPAFYWLVYETIADMTRNAAPWTALGDCSLNGENPNPSYAVAIEGLYIIAARSDPPNDERADTRLNLECIAPWRMNVHLSNANANFKNVYLVGSDFRAMSLRGADFTGAWLAGVNFVAADMQGAVLTNAELRGACLRKVAYQRWAAPPTPNFEPDEEQLTCPRVEMDLDG